MSAKLQFLYVNLGRGHPFYQDGILEALIHRGHIGLVRKELDAIALSRGLSRFAWKGAGWLYRTGSSSRFLMSYYNRLRSQNDYNRHGFMLRLMGRDLVRQFRHSQDPLLVAHPTLVGILSGRPDLLYQHGEHAVPPESLVQGAHTVFVPTVEAAQPFLESGYRGQQVIVSGLCIEPQLVRQSRDAFDARMKRLEQHQPLTGVLFSSGAEPRLHIEKLAVAARSIVYDGGRVIVFARHRGRLAGLVRHSFAGRGIGLLRLDASTTLPSELPEATLVEFVTRRELDIFTAQLFPQFDYFMAPSHERTNWALGLGLPMFVVGPSLGTFSPLNQALLERHAVARVIDSFNEANSFGSRIATLHRKGALERMASRGWGIYNISGFEQIADYLVASYGDLSAE
ncbi:MAG: hypothetical protein AB1644_11090 [Candidatus Zixiibacteriota bacterium]